MPCCLLQVGLVSGVPDSARARHATIGASARTAAMSGRARTVFNHNAPQWSIQFDTTVGGWAAGCVCTASACKPGFGSGVMESDD